MISSGVKYNQWRGAINGQNDRIHQRAMLPALQKKKPSIAASGVGYSQPENILGLWYLDVLFTIKPVKTLQVPFFIQFPFQTKGESVNTKLIFVVEAIETFVLKEGIHQF
jgi:hypothetical protein